MKKLLIVLLLSACSTVVPVKQTFPELPPEISQPCKNLLLLDGPTVTLSKLTEIVAKNYGLHHECSAQVDSLLKWHQEQKKIFNEANK
jgi:hypothetical protein